MIFFTIFLCRVISKISPECTLHIAPDTILESLCENNLLLYLLRRFFVDNRYWYEESVFKRSKHVSGFLVKALEWPALLIDFLYPFFRNC